MYDAKLSRKVHWLAGLGRRGLSSGGGGRKKAWDVAGDPVYTIFFFFPPWVEPRKTKSSPIGPNLPAHPVPTSTYSHMNTDPIHDHRHDRLTSSVGPQLPNLRACLPACLHTEVIIFPCHRIALSGQIPMALPCSSPVTHTVTCRSRLPKRTPIPNPVGMCHVDTSKQNLLPLTVAPRHRIYIRT